MNRCPVLKEPVSVQVKATGSEPQKVRIRGQEASISNRVNQMVVDTRNAGQGVPSVQMKGPNVCEARLLDNLDGTYLLEYGAIESGEYELSVLFDGKPVPKSPLKVQLVTSTNELGELAKRVQIKAPSDLHAQSENKFTVDVSQVCEDTETVTGSKDAAKKPIDAKKKPEEDKTKLKKAAPKSNEKAIDGKLKPKQALDAKLTNQAVDAVGPLTVMAATDSKKAIEKPIIQKQADGTYEVLVPAAETGSKCCVQIEYAGMPVDGSAFVGPVQPPVDAKKVHVDSMPSKVNASLPVQFTLDTSDAGPGQTQVSIQVC